MISQSANLHSSLKYLFIFGYIMGYFPISGLLKKRSDDLKFSWISLKTLHTLTLLVYNVLILCSMFVYMIIYDKSVSDFLALLIFTGVSLSNLIFFLNLANHWSQFIKKWNDVEKTIGTRGIKRNAINKCRSTVTLLLGARISKNNSIAVFHLNLLF